MEASPNLGFGCGVHSELEEQAHSGKRRGQRAPRHRQMQRIAAPRDVDRDPLQALCARHELLAARQPPQRGRIGHVGCVQPHAAEGPVRRRHADEEAGAGGHGLSKRLLLRGQLQKWRCRSQGQLAVRQIASIAIQGRVQKLRRALQQIS